MEFFVSLSGNDANPGTLDHPFRTIRKGISKLGAGDILSLRQGIYIEPVRINNKNGTPNENIVIRSFPGERACIDGCFPQFCIPNHGNWRLASLDDPQAHPDEFISTEIFTEEPVNRGAFLDRDHYTRLVTYSTLNDLRSDNETFDFITDLSQHDPRPGPEVMERCSVNQPEPECVLFQDGFRYKPALVRVECTADDPDPNCQKDGVKGFKFVRFRRPFVYMGPGLWFDPDTHNVHIRLSHTHNHVPGLPDYIGETDPNKIALAISSKGMRTLIIGSSKHLRLENLTIRFGGDETISLLASQGVVFDHVIIRASRFGVRMGGPATNRLTDTVFRHCEFDGGLPPWYFRTDRKAGYLFVANNKIVENNLGGNTLDALLLGNPNDTGTQIHHCEFHDAHDIFLHGANLTFHHNWINNLNDEGLFLDEGTPAQPQSYEMRIFQNVITKTLSALSFAGNHPKGNWLIYRNLIDLRSPTAGFRPRFAGDQQIWRFGQLIKIILPDGPRDLFQNTFLVVAQDEQASFLHYRDTSDNHLRRTFNNIFVAVNPDASADHAITFLPAPDFPGPTDGNDYHRIGFATRPLFRYLEYGFEDDPPCPENPHNDRKCGAGNFPNLAALRGDPNTVPVTEPSLLFKQSKSQYMPGYEANSIEADPRFCRIGEDGAFRETDDLRLSDASQAIAAGVTLPDDLRLMDPFAPASNSPDIGCYTLGSCPLQVGVDSRRSYPIE